MAEPVLEADSHAKVQMRKKVRGLGRIEGAVLQRPKVETKERPLLLAELERRYRESSGF